MSNDAISLLICNTDDNSYFLTFSSDYETRIPSTKVVEKQGWRHAIKGTLNEMLGIEPRSVNLMLTIKVWQGTEGFMTNSIFYITVNNEIMKKRKKHSDVGTKNVWKPVAEAAKMDFISPEINHFFLPPLEREKTLKSLEATANVMGSTFMEVLKEHILVGQSIKEVFEHLVIGCGWTEQDQISAFKMFFSITQPFILMGLHSFRKFMNTLGGSEEHSVSLFRAADITNRGGLTFKEFLCLMAFLEPLSLTQPACLEAQARYIFRYFDKTKTGVWGLGEIENYFGEVGKKMKKASTPFQIDKEIPKFYKDIEVTTGSEVPLLVFIKAVGLGKYKVPAGFLKGSKKLTDLIKEADGNTKKGGGGEPKGGSLSPGSSSVSVQKTAASPPLKSQQSTVCKVIMFIKALASELKPAPVGPLAEMKNYTMAYHVIRVGKGGYLDHTTFDKLKSCCSATTANNLFFSTKKSIQHFALDNPANEVLAGLRYFAQTSTPQDKAKEPFTWDKVEYSSLGKLIITLSSQVEEIMRNEPRLLVLNSPVYILGDVHGNFVDLYLFECALWPSGLHLSLGSVLFLGDYIDRGVHGVEVIGYLFANKVKNPQRLFLIRGNHEIRQVQRQFTFFNECQRKFGKDFGLEVWKAVNTCFDVMPVAALVDSQLFCCHGGVPPPWLCPTISVINNVPVPMSNPEAQSALAWELFWNDPIREEGLNDATITELSLNDGFAVNKRRGTAHVFNSAAVAKFLSVNNLSFVIRGHEVVDCGFKLQQSAKLTTIFSSSYYSGMINKAACLFVQDNKIRIVNIHTDDFHKAEIKNYSLNPPAHAAS